MIVEVVAAFALACNVLQVIDHGARVMQDCTKLGRSGHGLLVEHHELQALSQDLNGLNQKLERK